MQSFMQNLCAPPQPQLRPLTHSELLEDFCLEHTARSHLEDGGWMLESKESFESESQQETMEAQEDTFSAKRRHCHLIDSSSRRLMLSKLQRMDRAQSSTHSAQSSADIADPTTNPLTIQSPMMALFIRKKQSLLMVQMGKESADVNFSGWVLD